MVAQWTLQRVYGSRWRGVGMSNMAKAGFEPTQAASQARWEKPGFPTSPKFGTNSHSFPARRHNRPFLAVTYPPLMPGRRGFLSERVESLFSSWWCFRTRSLAFAKGPWSESNGRPSLYGSVALPSELQGRNGGSSQLIADYAIPLLALRWPVFHPIRLLKNNLSSPPT